MSGNITSANSVYTITVAGLFPVPQQLQGYSVERAWETEALALAEVQMGVDGRMTAGYVPNAVKQTISLQADSSSVQIFNSIAAAMRAGRTIYYINGTIDLPSTAESFICHKGVLQEFKPVPDAGKVLQALNFVIVWESIQPTLS